MNTVLIDAIGIQEPSWISDLEVFVDTVLHALKRSEWEISILLCDDQHIAAMNKDYRNVEGPTDVLSFAQIESADEIPVSGPFLAGDIVISLSYVQENANTYTIDFDEEFKRVIIHGILHLSGMDHESNSAQEPMLILQEELLKAHNGRIVFCL